MDGTPHFKAFSRSMYAGPEEPLDLRALRSLKGIERRTARAMLIEQLTQSPDDCRLGRAVATLRDPQLLPATRSAFAQASSDRARVSLAVALRTLGAFEETQPVIEQGLHSGEPAAQIESIKALTSAFPGPIDAVFAALAESEEPAVKAAAEQAIARRQARWGDRCS
ncbi:MAG: hypothetical protein ACE366_20845 [Bradymonadia bacterium]